MTFEPGHSWIYKIVHTVKIQISLCILAVTDSLPCPNEKFFGPGVVCRWASWFASSLRLSTHQLQVFLHPGSLINSVEPLTLSIVTEVNKRKIPIHPHLQILSELLLLLRCTKPRIIYFPLTLWFKPLTCEDNPISVFTYKSRHKKTCLCHMRMTKEQISLCIRTVWSAPLLLTA